MHVVCIGSSKDKYLDSIEKYNNFLQFVQDVQENKNWYLWENVV